MCGRYTLTVDQETLAVALGVEGLVHPEPRFNVAPSQEMPAVIHRDGEPAAATLRWGLVPFWASDPSIGNRMINARSETVHGKPAFRQAFARRRCLLPADGFYEWKKAPGGKRPFWIHREDRDVFTFAGLHERWKDEDADETLETFTILTTEPNELLAPIHDRMPVIVATGDRELWLDPGADPERVRGLLRPCPAGPLAVREVSTRVNSPAHDEPSCLEPPGGRPPGS